MFVIDWILAKFNYHKFYKVDKDAIEASLAANIALQKNPVVESGVPWAS